MTSMLPGAATYWIAPAFEVVNDGQPLPRPEIVDTRISTDADQSFRSYQDAMAHFASPALPVGENLFWDHVWLDSRLRFPLVSTTRAIAITPRVANLGVRVATTLTYVRAEGGHTFSFEGDPGMIYLDARWTDAVRQFLRHGGTFISRGASILLFLFCLALPFRRYRDIAPAIVLFSAAILVALLSARFGFAPDAVWFRPLIATLETVAILLIAFANIAGRVTPRRRALFALCAGLVFGYSSAFSLATTLQFAGDHPAIATVAFYAGLVAVTLAVIALLIPAVSWLFSFARIEYLERIIVSALAADTAWGWLTDRWSQLTKVPFGVVFDAGILAPTLRLLAIAVLFAGLLWFVNEWLKSYRGADVELVTPRNGRTAA